jgi:hypothetical protein
MRVVIEKSRSGGRKAKQKKRKRKERKKEIK